VRALDEAVAQAARLEPAERPALLGQAAVLRVRVAVASQDGRAVAAAVDAARDALPADQRARAVAARLFALHEMHDDATLLRTMDADLAAVRDTPEEGAAVLLAAAALERAGRADDARRVLESLVERRPDTAEAARARLTLADVALGHGDFAAGRQHLEQFLASPDVTSRHGKEAVAQASYNLAVATLRLDDPSAAAAATERVRLLASGTPLCAKALVLLGQARAAAADWPGAAKAWSDSLEIGAGIDEADVRARLARALVAAGKPAEAEAEFARLAERAGGVEKLSPADREALARALFAKGEFAAAAAAYDALAAGQAGTASQAYEAGVCHERAERWAEADKAYTRAERGRDTLPATYAAALPESLARVRLRGGTSDRGLSYWVGRLEPGTPDDGFTAALATMATIAGGTSAVAAPLDRLEKLVESYGPQNPRAFGVGAVLLQFAAAQDQPRMRRLAPRLAADYAAAAAKLPADTWSTTVAPAMIQFHLGEVHRAAGDHAAALAAYETVLAAHPFNEWPDAAACGAAECYAALGDTATAVARLTEVAAAADRAASPWVATARRRLSELSSNPPRGEGR
jgi:tetratricopeptide (TPR) repeat protein